MGDIEEAAKKIASLGRELRSVNSSRIGKTSQEPPSSASSSSSCQIQPIPVTEGCEITTVEGTRITVGDPIQFLKGLFPNCSDSEIEQMDPVMEDECTLKITKPYVCFIHLRDNLFSEGAPEIDE